MADIVVYTRSKDITSLIRSNRFNTFVIKDSHGFVNPLEPRFREISNQIQSCCSVSNPVIEYFYVIESNSFSILLSVSIFESDEEQYLLLKTRGLKRSQKDQTLFLDYSTPDNLRKSIITSLLEKKLKVFFD